MLQKKRCNEVYRELIAIQRTEIGTQLPTAGQESVAAKLWQGIQQLTFYAFLNDAGLEVSYKNMEHCLLELQPTLDHPGALQDAILKVIETLILTYVSTTGISFPDIETANDFYGNMDVIFFDDKDELMQSIEETVPVYKDFSVEEKVDLFLKRNKNIIQHVTRFGFK